MIPTYEVRLIVEGVKEEHVSYFARMALALGELFKLDGTDVQTRVSVGRDSDDLVERVFEFLGEEE